jgi:cytochrome c peroxidase
MRGLASRAPYFHNGSAASLTDVIVFYDMRFNIGFYSPGESRSDCLLELALSGVALPQPGAS